ncbi:Rv3235 family protein [Actinoplanes sp. NPDC049316]|uniref:Rv3235 family protein n=1 Tax=Actinoplanes sp. NPDC049316 TaxID=3154727 RepID=UPI003426A2D9
MSTAQMTRQDTKPAIRLRRAPHSDPPYDDEREPDSWSSPHQLAFDLARLLPTAPTTTPAPALATPTARRPPARQAPAGPAAPTRPGAAAAASSTGVSPDARLAVRRFIGLCVEVVNGYRPAAHLRRLAQPREAAAVVAQGVTAAHRVAEARRKTATRHGTERHPRSRRPAPAAVVKVSLCEPRPGAVEAAAVLVIGDRAWAMALRLERHDDVWLATVLRLI